jgi:hypothetical protein
MHAHLAHSRTTQYGKPYQLRAPCTLKSYVSRAAAGGKRCMLTWLRGSCNSMAQRASGAAAGAFDSLAHKDRVVLF